MAAANRGEPGAVPSALVVLFARALTLALSRKDKRTKDFAGILLIRSLNSALICNVY